MGNYYSEKLSADRLRRCYEIASPRIQQYLRAEVDFVLERIKPDAIVLELGCGYGRVMAALARKARWVVGVDTSVASLMCGLSHLHGVNNCSLFAMNAIDLAFRDRTFDVVVCIQNGISAFHVDQQRLISESIRAAKQGARILFSSYSKNFWEERLEWFRRQAEAGLVGEIDFARTRAGVIVCKDGFTATTVNKERFHALTSKLDVETTVTEVDESSLFCEITRV
ncbi:MAG: class I SAM-dependent methyltransferase [Ignavibacteriae bacterium]|nr:class I SAM-dependent methyltransferase [Ignavibacteriota bacterium]